jgi:hypothetical protein
VREADPTPPSIAVDKNEWSYSSIPHMSSWFTRGANFYVSNLLCFCLYDTSAVQSTKNAVIKAVLCNLPLDVGQELCSDGLSSTGKANTHVCASICHQQDSNTFPWKRVESYLNIKFPGGESVIFALFETLMYPCLFRKA